jgi:hypothetical protein
VSDFPPVPRFAATSGAPQVSHFGGSEPTLSNSGYGPVLVWPLLSLGSVLVMVEVCMSVGTGVGTGVYANVFLVSSVCWILLY